MRICTCTPVLDSLNRWIYPWTRIDPKIALGVMDSGTQSGGSSDGRSSCPTANCIHWRASTDTHRNVYIGGMYMFRAFCKFTQFRNCAAQIRNCEIANRFRNGNPISKLRSAILKFRYSWRRDRVYRWWAQEIRTSIISDRVLKRSAKNAMPIETTKRAKRSRKIRDRRSCDCSRVTP